MNGKSSSSGGLGAEDGHAAEQPRRATDAGQASAAASSRGWADDDRKRLPLAIALSAALQLGFVLALPEPELLRPVDPLRGLGDRFVTVILQPKPPQPPEPEPIVAAAEPKPEVRPKPEPKPKPEVAPKAKPRPKRARRARRVRRPAKAQTTAQPSPKQQAAPAPPPPIAMAAPANAIVSADAPLVLDLELSGTARPGLVGSAGGVGGVAGGTLGGTPGGVVGGRGDGPAQVFQAYEVDRLPTCPRLTPAYPKDALRAEEEADVKLRLRVGTDGRVTQVRVRRAAGAAFDRAATRAARGLRCKPAQRAGQSVPVWIDYEVAFRVVASWSPAAERSGSLAVAAQREDGSAEQTRRAA